MLKLAVFQNDLGVGGIQKSLVNLLKNLDYSRVSVDLYLSEGGDFWQADFPAGVRVRRLKPTPKLYSFIPFPLARRLLRYEFDDEVYDLAIDFNSYQCSCAVAATTVRAKKRVMWIHNDVEIKLQNEWKYRILWHFFQGKFAFYDGFVPVSRALIEPFQRASGVSDKPFTVIANYIDVSGLRSLARETPKDFAPEAGCFHLVALGRLVHQKGYDLMLPIFAEAHEKRPELRLWIIGDGPERGALEAQADKLHLGDAVRFLGNQANPYAYMARMDAFLSTSRYEGQPLNIMEARALGLPLYCSRNLEKYAEGLVGYDDLPRALIEAECAEKRPDDLLDYNRAILDAVVGLAENHTAAIPGQRDAADIS